MKRNKVFVEFTADEYSVIGQRAKELGMSIPKLVAYATTLYIDMPRTEIPNLGEIQNSINDFIDSFEGESFICATPFGERWTKMTTSSKRTAAAQMKKLADAGFIEKIAPTSKAHQAARYRKVK